MIIDSTALTTFQACPLRFRRRMRDGWRSRYQSNALGFGSAIHAGLAEWHRGNGLVAALQAVEQNWKDPESMDDYRTLSKCLEVMTEYSKRYPKEVFITKMIEVPFQLDLGVRCFDGEPIEYGGIFDGLVDHTGQVFILEHKSTSMLGSQYFNQFRPNNQVTGYVWAAQQLSGANVAGALINAIGVYAKGATKFERQLTSRTQFEIDEWKQNVKHVCDEIRRAELNDTWEMRTNSCVQYGRCEFLNICQLGQAKERQRLLEQDYLYEPWNFSAQDR